jgi:hypothetical protein
MNSMGIVQLPVFSFLGGPLSRGLFPCITFPRRPYSRGPFLPRPLPLKHIFPKTFFAD